MTRGSRGFTLVEVLVGMVLLAAFLGGIYTVAVGSMVAKRRIEESAAVYTAGPEILDLIDRDLRSVYISGVKDAKAFKAQQQSVGGKQVTVLDLVTTTNSKVSIKFDEEYLRSDVTEIGYRLKTSDDFPGMLELYRREQFFFDDEPLAGGQYYLVYDRVISLSMRFFEPPETALTSSTASKEGFEDWDSKDKGLLPQAVKIELVLGPPPEDRVSEGQEERQYRFVRWVLLPTAFDKSPAPPSDEPGTNQPPR